MGRPAVKAYQGVIAVASALVAGACGSDATQLTKDEQQRFLNPPPRTASDNARIAAAMADSARKSADHQRQWRKDHPEEAAKMDAQRAAAGMPPIGG